MESEDRAQMPKSLRYWNKIYNGYVTINVKHSAFPAEN